MEHVEFGDIAVDFEVTGQGDQVALLHASPFVSWYAPLVDLMDDYSVLRYRRTVPLDGRPFSIEDDAAVCAQLLGHVGFDRPHVVGHSYGGVLALALARSRAVALRTIALLEPARSGFLDPEQATAGLAPLMELYRTQGPAVDRRAVPRRRARRRRQRSARSVPPRQLSTRSSPTPISSSRSSFRRSARWSFGRDDARLIDQPILNVIGTETVPRFVQTAEIVQSLFPDAKRVELPGAGHLMMAQVPAEMATILREFWH